MSKKREAAATAIYCQLCAGCALCPITGYIDYSYNAHGLGKEHNFYLNLGHSEHMIIVS